MRKALAMLFATAIALSPVRAFGVWLEGQRPVFTGKIAAVFDTPGTYTWTVPDGVWRIMVEMWGGGGGGAMRSHGGTQMAGGGAGGYGFASIDVVPGMTCTISIGAGGNSGTWGGTDGGRTSISCGSVSYYADGGQGAPSYSSGGSGRGSNAPFSITGGGGVSAHGSSTEGEVLQPFGGTSPRGGIGGIDRQYGPYSGSRFGPTWPGGGGICDMRGCNNGAPGGLVIYY